MARITDTLLVQRVGDDKIVMVDDSTGQEFVFPLEVTPNVVAALIYLHDPDPQPTPFVENLRAQLNRHCMENGSDTPDFILAAYLVACLDAFDVAVKARSAWYGGRTPPWEDQREAASPSGPAKDR